MAKSKKVVEAPGAEDDQTPRELFVEELAARITNVRHEEIAEAIVWAIEQCGGSVPTVPGE